MTEFYDLHSADGWMRLLLWQVPLAVACVWCAALCLAQRPQWRSWLWRIALLKCGLCVALPVSLAIPLLRGESRSEQTVSVNNPPAVFAAAAEVQEVPAERPPSETLAEIPQSPSRDAPVISVNLYQVLASLWLVGVVAIFAVWTRRWLQVKRLVADAAPVDDPRLGGLLDELTNQQGLKRPPRVAVTAQTVSPLLIGWLRPQIIVPAWLLAEEHESELRTALAHELAHIRRRDLFWNLLGAVVGGVYFFHPLVWFALRRLRIAQESAADDLALRTTATPPTDYARMLVQIAEAARGRPALHPALLTASRSYLDLSERIRFLNASQHPRRAGALALLAVPLILLVGIVPWHPIVQRLEVAADEPQAAETKPVSAERNAEMDAAVKRMKDHGVFVQEFGKRDNPKYWVQIGTEKSDGTFNIEDAEIMGRGVPMALSLVNVAISQDDLKQLSTVKNIMSLELSGDNVTDEVLAVLPELPIDSRLTLGDGPYTVAGMKHVAACENVRQISLKGKHVSDEFLESLTEMPNLEEIGLQAPGFTPKAFEIQLRLRGLKSLRLPYRGIGAEPLKLTPEDIAKLSKLQTIDLSGKHYGDETARALAEHCPDLETVFLRRTSVTTAGAKELARLTKLKILELTEASLDDGIADAIRQMKRLEWLDLDGCPIGDTTMAAVAECSELRSVRVGRAKVTDDGVKYLLKLPKLNTVYVWFCKGVTDESLDVFRELPNADKRGSVLNLQNTSISEDGIRSLIEALPNATILHSFPK